MIDPLGAHKLIALLTEKSSRLPKRLQTLQEVGEQTFVATTGANA